MIWKTVKLGDYCKKIGSGATPKGGSMVYISQGTSLIRSQNVYNLYFEYSGLTHITKEAAQKLDGVTIQENDILLNITGDSVARVCIVPIDVIPARVNQHVAIIRTNTSLNAKYLVYYLASPKMQAYMLNLAVGKGASRNALTKGMIEDFPLVLPPIETQKKIADILSAYDDLIENNQKQIKLLEEAAQRLYKEWFVDLHFPGHESTPITDGIPQGWKKDLIGNLIDKSYRSKQVMTSGYLQEGKIPIIDQSRDFIGGYTNDTETLVDLGKPVIVFGDHTRILKYIQFPFAKGADGTQLIISKCGNMPQPLLYLSLLNVDLSNYHYARHFKYLKAEQIIVPDIQTAETFVSFIIPIFQKVQILRDQIHNARQARDRLLPKLMNGEIEVSMDKKETVKIDNFDYIRKHWRNTPYNKDLPLAARSTGDISEETLEKLKEIAEEE